MLEAIVIGFAVVLLAVQAVLAMGALTATGNAVEDAARRGALVLARTGSPAAAVTAASDGIDDASIAIVDDPDGVTVVVSAPVRIVGPEAASVTMTVTGRATVRVSPYRSGR